MIIGCVNTELNDSYLIEGFQIGLLRKAFTLYFIILTQLPNNADCFRHGAQCRSRPKLRTLSCLSLLRRWSSSTAEKGSNSKIDPTQLMDAASPAIFAAAAAAAAASSGGGSSFQPPPPLPAPHHGVLGGHPHPPPPPPPPPPHMVEAAFQHPYLLQGSLLVFMMGRFRGEK